jgi:inositol-pentakisphosphate 2-kinase
MDKPALPDDRQVQFVGEGAANVVFNVEVHPGKPAYPGTYRTITHFISTTGTALTEVGYLLRVPKAGTSAFSYQDLQEYWETTVAPLFRPGLLVGQSLVSLEGEGIVSKLNAVLEENEHARRKDFRGSRVANANHGMLVEDMRRRDASDWAIEFKPKWLSQSSAAPPDATRCRNCAREAYRASKDGKVLGSQGHLRPLCPLALVYGRDLPCKDEGCRTGESGCEDPDCEVGAMASALLSGVDDTLDEDVRGNYRGQLSRWIRLNELLPLLQSLQIACDTGLQSDQELNMTLRDCACFVRLSLSGRPVEARLGDLDRKNGAAKRQYWEDTERKLVDGGYYEGKEVPRQSTACWLERTIQR